MSRQHPNATSSMLRCHTRTRVLTVECESSCATEILRLRPFGAHLRMTAMGASLTFQIGRSRLNQLSTPVCCSEWLDAAGDAARVPSSIVEVHYGFGTFLRGG